MDTYDQSVERKKDMESHFAILSSCKKNKTSGHTRHYDYTHGHITHCQNDRYLITICVNIVETNVVIVKQQQRAYLY